MNEKQTSSYELTFIVLENETDKGVLEILQKTDAKISKNIDLGVKQLAFPIKKQKAGHYFSVKFEVEPSKLPELEKSLKLEKSLIRYLVICALRFSAAKPTDNTRPTKPTDQTVKQPIILEEKGEKKPEEIIEPKAEIKIETPEERPEIIKPVIETPKEEPVKIEKPEVVEKKIELKPATVKPSAKKPAKAVKVEASELDKTLEELVKE